MSRPASDAAPALTQRPAQRPLIGIVLLLLSLLCLTTLDASGKWVMGAGISLLILVWFRYVIHLSLVLIFILPTKGLGILHSKTPGLQCLRAAAMLGATLTFFTSLQYLPQAEATAIIFISPLIMLAVAPWILKEPMRKTRWVAAGFCFVGVLLVISAWPTLTTMEPWVWVVMLSTGFTGGVGHFLQIQAYRFAPASMLAPFIYLQMTVAATLGWLIWSHFPDATTWLGIAIICASGVVNSLIEWQRSRPSPA